MTDGPAAADPGPEAAPPPPRRDVAVNAAVLTGDVTCFLVGMAFLDSSTALPALVARLGGTPSALALLVAVRQAGYYLPQLFVAHRLRGRPLYKPYILKVCALGRVWLFGAALAIYAFGQTRPALALTAFGIAYGLAWLGDGMGGAPWTAIVGKAVPARQRGRLFAATQVLGGVGRLGVGAVVRTLFSEKGVPSPAGAATAAPALLVLGAAVFLALSWVFLALIRESPAAAAAAANEEAGPSAGRRGFLAFLREIGERARTRPDVPRLAAAQILATAVVAASPFLLAHAERHTPGGLPPSIAGTFLMVQTAGLLVCAPLLGLLNDRRGPRAATVALFALALGSTAAAVLGAVLPIPSAPGALALFFAAYFCLGASADSWIVLSNYLLESTPDHHDQTLFIALMNASSAPVLVLPLLLGRLVAPDGSATPAFAAAALLLAAGLAVAATLPDTRRPRRR